MATMKAARWHAAKDVRIEEVEVPEVQPHQVKVAVKFTGICGTDLHEYLDGNISKNVSKSCKTQQIFIDELSD